VGLNVATKRKKVTLNEFKAWLEGVEELQPKNWSPSSEQWKLIRTKMDYIIIPPEAQQSRVPNPMVPPQLQQIPGMVPAPPVGGIPANSIVDMSAEAKKMLGGSSDGKHPTPNIDTSDGNFNSSFE
jgi:predicted transcriptional regulator